MQNKVWTIIAVSLSSVALTLVIVLFIIIIMNASNNSSSYSKEQQQLGNEFDLPGKVDALSNKSIHLEDPPHSLDGVALDKGSMVYLNAQENESENGFYNINSSNMWSHLSEPSDNNNAGDSTNNNNNNRHLVYVRNGREFGRNLVMVGGNSPPRAVTNNPCVIKMDEIATTPRRLTVQEVRKGSLICEANVILPEPQEFKFSTEGEMISFNVYNRSEAEDIEIGYSSHWVSKCDNTNLDRLTGCILALRFIGNSNGEVYRVSV